MYQYLQYGHLHFILSASFKAMFLFFLHCILWRGVVPFVVDAKSIFSSHSFGLAIVASSEWHRYLTRGSAMKFQLIRPSFDCFSLDERFLWHHLLFAPIWRLQCTPPKSQGPDILTWAFAPKLPSIGRAVSLSSAEVVLFSKSTLLPMGRTLFFFLGGGGVMTPACLWGNNVFKHTFSTIAFRGSCIKHRSSESHCVYHVFVRIVFVMFPSMPDSGHIRMA